MSLFDVDLMERMQAKILLLADPNSGYTQEDFDKEFNTMKIDVDYDSHKIKFGFVNESNNPDPEYATAGSSGFDLRANLESPVTIPPHGIKIIPTGLYFEIPENFEIQVRPRSGLAAKNGVTVLNTPGTVDSDYRGEIGVILINHGTEPFNVNVGDRIAQMVMAHVEHIQWQAVGSLSSSTKRGEKGFGSTGK
jgi:dUTP pyrophosphatase